VPTQVPPTETGAVAAAEHSGAIKQKETEQPKYRRSPLADMNVTPSRPGLTPIQWQSDFWVEYIRENQFTPYFGTSMDAMIQLQTDLTRKPGDTVVFPTIRNLVGSGVTGNVVLEGNEEILNARSLNVTVGVIRHAVAVSDWDEQKSVIDLLQGARSVLKNWAANKLRSDIITAFGSITADANVVLSYAAATAAQRNYWMVNNADRILFGASKSNAVSGVMATALATITPATGKMSAAQLTLAKRIARTATPKIRPIRLNNDEEWYVVFVPSLCFRDLMLDPVIVNALQYAWNRGSDNPLFTAGDIIYDGMIIREIPELPVLAGVGGGPSDVAASYLAGAQAIGIAWAQRTKVITNSRDYGFFQGTGVEEIRGVQKLRFGTDPTVDTTKPVDNGSMVIFSSAPADA
jgi:N4-gp56 family major capsid protein